MSNRFRGANAVAVRREPVPSAYRVFFRHIGLDPEVVRTPIEAAVFDRMMHGGFISAGLLEDVLLIALLDTGVPVWALDAECVDGPLGIRASVEGERLGRGEDTSELPDGRLVVADAAAPLAVLFGELAAAHAAALALASAGAVRGAGRWRARAVRRGGAMELPRLTAGAMSAPAVDAAGEPQASPQGLPRW